jgi:hypothetical protein
MIGTLFEDTTLRRRLPGEGSFDRAVPPCPPCYILQEGTHTRMKSSDLKSLYRWAAAARFSISSGDKSSL